MNGTYFNQMKQYIPNLNNLLNIIISAIHSLGNILLMYILKGTCKDSIKQYILNMNNVLNIIFFYCIISYNKLPNNKIYLYKIQNNLIRRQKITLPDSKFVVQRLTL